MNGDDMDGFAHYLGNDSEMTWAISEMIAESLVFDFRIPRFARYPFLAICLDLLEEDAYLEVFGCLDAPL